MQLPAAAKTLQVTTSVMHSILAFLFSAALVSTSTSHNQTSLLLPTNPTKASPCPLRHGEQSVQIVNEPPTWPYQVFKSSPFNPPQLKITTNGNSVAPGLIFFTPSRESALVGAKDVAPLIMTDTGQLVYNGPTVNATNFRHAKYRGKDILTYWSGLGTTGANIGHGYGSITFLDSSYNEILNVCPHFGLVTPDDITHLCEADLHESYTTDRDTILVTAYNTTTTDLTSVGGPKFGWVFDCLVFEIEPGSGTILFRWSALEHIAVSESKQPLQSTGRSKSAPWDWFHINSVVNIDDTFLVNSRHLWTTYLLNKKGTIVWQIAGDTGGDFGPLPVGGNFRWQHHARPHNVTNTSMSISWFNNNNQGFDNGTKPSIGLKLQLTLPPNKATPPIILEYLSDPVMPVYADSQGSTELLPNGNIIMDYGQIAVLKEYGHIGANGTEVRWTARFGADNVVQSYRGFKQIWHATPTTSPNLVVENDGACRVGYVSWNGATDITAWAIFDGPSGSQLSLIGQVLYMGFETTFTVAGRCVQVAAIINGRESTKSNVACIQEA